MFVADFFANIIYSTYDADPRTQGRCAWTRAPARKQTNIVTALITSPQTPKTDQTTN